MLAAALLAVAALAAPAGAEVFRCKAADGKLSYQDTPCPKSSSETALPLVPRSNPAGDREVFGRPAELVKTQGQPAPPPPPEPKCSLIDEDEQQVLSARRAAVQELAKRYKEDDAARFSATRYARLKCDDGSERLFACGKVDARNAQGAYAGDRSWLFAVTDKGNVGWVEEAPGPSNARMRAALAQCMEMGR